MLADSYSAGPWPVLQREGLFCLVTMSWVVLLADSYTAGPWPVLQGGCSVAIVFREEVQGDVTLKVEQTDLQLTTTRETATVFTFVAPRECVCYVCRSMTRRGRGRRRGHIKVAKIRRRTN